MIANPKLGLLVYDLDKATVYFYDGAKWRPLSFTTENRLPLIERTATESEDATCMLGYDVAVYGIYAAAGAPSEKVNSNWDQGSVYIYAQQNNTWNLQQKVWANDGINGDFFGGSIALYNDLLVVGAHKAAVNAVPGNGAAYIFKRTGGVWSQVKKLVPPTNEANGRFGYDVSVYNGKILVSAPGKTLNGKAGAGVAYLYESVNNDWQLTKEFKGTTPVTAGNFGESVKLYGNDAVIGYPGNVVNGIITGSVQVFTRTPPVATWQEKSIVSGITQDKLNFGDVVDIYMDTLLVGAPYYNHDADVEDQIWAGRYERWVRTNGNWLVDGFEGGTTKYQGMGYSVAINGPYQFVLAGPTNKDTRIDGKGPAFSRQYHDVDGMVNIGFGSGIAISGNHFIIGAPAKNGQRGSVQFGNVD